jgi:hypothetical protein
MAFGAAVDLGGGNEFTCALTAAGELLCWCADDVRELGELLREHRDHPRPERGGNAALDLGAW